MLRRYVAVMIFRVASATCTRRKETGTKEKGGWDDVRWTGALVRLTYPLHGVLSVVFADAAARRWLISWGMLCTAGIADVCGPHADFTAN